MAPSNRIGTKIRRARERKRMSQAELADALSVSRSAVNAWENDRAYPQSSIGALEEILGIRLDEPEPESVIPPDLLAKIRQTIPIEDQGRVIAALERELAGTTSPREGESSSPSADPGRRAAG